MGFISVVLDPIVMSVIIMSSDVVIIVVGQLLRILVILILGSVISVMSLVVWRWSGHVMCVIGIRVIRGWRVGIFVEILVVSLGRIRFLIMVVCVIVKLTSGAMWRRPATMCGATAKVVGRTERCSARASSTVTRIGCTVGMWGTASKAKRRALSIRRAARTLRGMRGAMAWSIVGWTGDRIPSTTPGAEPPRDARDSGSARSHSTHLETSSSNRP